MAFSIIANVLKKFFSARFHGKKKRSVRTRSSSSSPTTLASSRDTLHSTVNGTIQTQRSQTASTIETRVGADSQHRGESRFDSASTSEAKLAQDNLMLMFTTELELDEPDEMDHEEHPLYQGPLPIIQNQFVHAPQIRERAFVNSVRAEIVRNSGPAPSTEAVINEVPSGFERDVEHHAPSPTQAQTDNALSEGIRWGLRRSTHSVSSQCPPRGKIDTFGWPLAV